MTGIYISTVILSSLLGAVIYITNTKVSKNQLVSFAMTIGVMYLMKDFIAARAQLVTFILFVLEILFIECFLEKKKKRYAIRINGYSMPYSKSSCGSILCIFYTYDAIFWRIYNNSYKRFLLYR